MPSHQGVSLINATSYIDAEQLYRLMPHVPQILLFSATFPDKVVAYAKQFCPAANEIRLKREELAVRGIKQMFMDCPSDESKYHALINLYGLMTIGSSIIFVKVR